jgi:hypothetical protein
MRRRRIDHGLVRALAEAEINGCGLCKQDCLDWVCDILSDLGVPADLHCYTCRDLVCPNCEARLAPGTWIQRCDTEDRSSVHFVARSIHTYRKNLTEFHEFLSCFPTLGLDHPVGAMINRSIRRFPIAALQGQQWIRAQRLERAEELTAERMSPPDPAKHKISQGRYNHEGQSTLYVSENVETAVAEQFERPGKESDGLCGVQSFEITSLDRVLDLRGVSSRSLFYAALVFDRYLDRSVDHTSSWKPEYLVPRFVADVARRKGFDGIVYWTTKVSYAAGGSNLVIFHPSPDNHRPCGAPALHRRKAYRTSLGLGDAELVNYEVETVPAISLGPRPFLVYSTS